MKYIDAFLNRITMYKLVLYYLCVLFVVALIECFFGILPYNPLYLLFSAAVLLIISWIVNYTCARIWHIPTNTESAYITALIITLIMTPTSPAASFFVLVWAAVLSQVSKYILSISGKHLFNPVAIGVASIALLFNSYASWWVGGTLVLMPVVILGGLLIVRKIHRFDMVLTYIATAIIVGIVPTVLDGGNIATFTLRLVEHTPIFFFACVMLTEPLTTPPRRAARVVYGAIVAGLATPWVHFWSFAFTPETALLAGNVFSYLTSSPFKKLATLTQINALAHETYEYVFDAHATFIPGQYAEWTLNTKFDDSRGNRRYFTIASSPTESALRIGVKIYDKPSAYKQSLVDLKVGDTVLVGSIAGDFTMPRDTKRKLVFIAGGIGITPFRSMIQYLIDIEETRDIVLLYSNRNEHEIAYRDIFDATTQTNPLLRIVYTLTNTDIPSKWDGERALIDRQFIIRTVPDYTERTFMISGPQQMVSACKSELLALAVSHTHIKTDYFPGFA